MGLTSIDAEVVKSALGGNPVQGTSEMEDQSFPLALRLPEDLALFRRYADPNDQGMVVGVTMVPLTIVGNVRKSIQME